METLASLCDRMEPDGNAYFIVKHIYIYVNHNSGGISYESSRKYWHAQLKRVHAPLGCAALGLRRWANAARLPGYYDRRRGCWGSENQHELSVWSAQWRSAESLSEWKALAGSEGGCDRIHSETLQIGIELDFSEGRQAFMMFARLFWIMYISCEKLPTPERRQDLLAVATECFAVLLFSDEKSILCGKDCKYTCNYSWLKLIFELSNCHCYHVSDQNGLQYTSGSMTAVPGNAHFRNGKTAIF